MTKNLILYLSPTGLTPTKEAMEAAGIKNIEIPYSPSDIEKVIRSVQIVFAGAYPKGVGMIMHTHIRNADGVDTLESREFQELRRKVDIINARNLEASKLGLFYTSSVPESILPIFDRTGHISAAPKGLKPLGGTALWGNFQFGRSNFFNPYDEVVQYANTVHKKGMILENEVMIFAENESQKTDVILGLIQKAIHEGVFKRPLYINIVVGPAGLNHDYISKQVKHIQESIIESSKEAGIKGDPLVIIGGAIPPEEAIKLAMDYDLDGVRFGAGECRADPKCKEWAASSPILAEQVIAAANKRNISFATYPEIMARFKEIGLNQVQSPYRG